MQVDVLAFLARPLGTSRAMAGLKSLGRLGGGASRASPAVSPREPSPIDRSIHPVRESDTPEPDVHEERPRVDGPPAKTLDDYDRMTPGAAAAFKDALVELVEERPFAARPLLPRTPAINNAAAPVEERYGLLALGWKKWSRAMLHAEDCLQDAAREEFGSHARTHACTPGHRPGALRGGTEATHTRLHTSRPAVPNSPTGRFGGHARTVSST